MATIQDPYRTLGVARHARLEDIRAAYYAQMKLHHPDRNPGDEAKAERASVAIGEAFRILGHPETRAAYDAGASGATSPKRPSARRIGARSTPPPGRSAAQGRRSKPRARIWRRVGLVLLGVASLAGVGGLVAWANGGWPASAAADPIAGDLLTPYLLAPHAQPAAPVKSALSERRVRPAETGGAAVAPAVAIEVGEGCESGADAEPQVGRSDQAVRKLLLDRFVPSSAEAAGAPAGSPKRENCSPAGQNASSAADLAQP